MQVYVGGVISEGHSRRRINEFEFVTSNPYEAFAFCYVIGLDGNDYWLYQYDVKTGTKKSLCITDAKYHTLWSYARANWQVYMQKPQRPLRAEDV